MHQYPPIPNVNLHRLQQYIEYQFQDMALLICALTHRSYLNEHPEHTYGHNERMEFLGDAVLELIVTELLYYRYKDKPEGELTNYRAALVKGDHLYQVGQKFFLEEFMFVSKGEKKDPSSKRYIVANAVEALIAGLYLDGGLAVAKRFVEKFFMPDLGEIVEKQLFLDSKSKFQERVQDKYSVTPTYHVIDEWGPDHEKQFRVVVMIKDKEVGVGEGSSKQKAEQAAAKNALENEEV
jgi:ribonuclease-3